MKERQEKRRSQSDFCQKSCTVQNEGIIKYRNYWRRTDNNKHQTPNKVGKKEQQEHFERTSETVKSKLPHYVYASRGEMPETRNENRRILELVTGIGREINPLYGYG
jgi:hypothetical protein